MLEDPRQPVVGLDALGFAVSVLRFDEHVGGPIHISRQPWQTQATLLANLRPLRLDDLRVDHLVALHRLFRALGILRIFDDEDALIQPDLRRSQTDALALPHRFYHVLQKLMQMYVERPYSFRRTPQDLPVFLPWCKNL